MDRIEFTLDGTRYELDQDMVKVALRGQTPGRIQVHAVEVDGTYYPVKQALASALRIPKSRFISTRAVELLRKIGMNVVDTDLDGSIPHRGPGSAHSPAYDGRTKERALSFAIAHAAGSTTTADEVLAIATRYAEWLSVGTVRDHNEASSQS